MKVSESSGESAPGPNWSAAQWMMGVGYLWFFAGIAAFTPFAAIYYRQLGFSGGQVGLLVAMPAIALALTGAFWGAVADTLAVHRVMLRISLALGAVFALLASRAEGFPLLLAWITILSFSIVPLRSLLDHYAVLVGSRTATPFGRIRLWGAFGYTAFALTIGRLMNENLTSLFLVAYSISLMLTLISTFYLPQLPAQERRPLLEGIGELVQNRRLMLLLLVAFAQAVAAFLIVASLGAHIKSLGGSTSQIGAAFAIAAVSELPIFVAGVWLYRKLGPDRMIAIIVALYVARMLALSAIGSSDGVVWLQTLHGVTFGAFLVAGVPRAHELAKGHYPATVQALLTMAAFGFGNIVGSFAGGALLDRTADVYLYTAIGLVVILIIYVFGIRYWATENSPRDRH